jgi:cyanophycinase
MGLAAWGTAFIKQVRFCAVVLVACCAITSCSSHSTQKLLLVGGGHIPDEAIENFQQWSSGPDANILVVSWATEDPAGAFGFYRDRFEHGYEGEIVHAVPKDELLHRKAEFADQVRKAKGIFFSGGDQNHVLDALELHPDVGELLSAAYHRGVAIGGTSAGTAIMSAVSLTGKTHPAARQDDVDLRTGLGLLRDLILDQHFLKRQRFGRLLAALKKSKFPLGLGIDENAALAVEDSQFAKVVGEHKVIAIQSTDSNQYSITELQPGDVYDIQRKQVVSAP